MTRTGALQLAPAFPSHCHRGIRSYRSPLAFHLSRDAFNGVVRGEDGPFLPGNKMREVVIRKIGAALGLCQLGIRRRARLHSVVGEAAKGVRNLCPADINWLLQ